MPQPFELRRDVVGSTVLVSYGGALLAAYDRDEQGMRNFAIVSLTRAGRPGVEIAKLFGVRPEHVSRLRRMADEGGASALVPTRGRPRALKASEESRIYVLADEGRSGVEIARMMGVSAATISRRLARRPELVIENPALEFTATDTNTDTEGDTEGEDEADTEGDTDTEGNTEGEDEDEGNTEGEGEGLSTTELRGDVASETKRSQIAKISAGEAECGYTGAMLLHSFFDRAGANTVLGALPSAPARRYDAASLMLSMTFGFALGASSAEGTKHLLGTDAGALVGLESFPHLRTLRPRLCGLAQAVDPLEIQSALAKHMLAADDLAPEVFFVDDHFVAYTGSADVAKGWNTRRRLAEAGRDDTFIVDDTWRAICFSSGPPSGLSKTMWAPLDALQEICSKRPITIGFDRGGSYPKVFAELERRGHNWITYRRAPLARPTVAPRHCSVVIDGDRHYLTVADEIVELDQVGAVRQISIYEAGKVVLQILTSDLLSSAAVLAHRLRCRWSIVMWSSGCLISR
ncbi:MAG: helix-turn-helix domain-containing protein [Actinobacteria bacterium]|nr:helix-turn-helix domain-containing protein [Actinomycetota bacterium]